MFQNCFLGNFENSDHDDTYTSNNTEVEMNFYAETSPNEIFSNFLMSEDEESSSEENEKESDDVIYESVKDSNLDLINGSIDQKIKNWILRNIHVLTQSSIDDILMVLRSEGYTSLPKSVKTLLGTSCLGTEKRIMKSADDTMGHFKYFGITENLSAIIDPDIYISNEINLIIHVDGMDLFNKSKKGFWSIMGNIFAPKYTTKPFLIALFFGNSKPDSPRDFLKEFVSEANNLIKEGKKFHNFHTFATNNSVSFLRCQFTW